jgi:DNA-binding beta-propeller fold protein YncE
MRALSGFRLLIGLSAAALIPSAAASANTLAPEPCPPIPGVNDRCPTWVSTYDNPDGDSAGSETDWATDVAVDPAGQRIYVTGHSWDNRTGGDMGTGRAPGGSDVATLALDPVTGERLWTHRYDGPNSYWDTPTDMAISPDGETVFVVGVQEKRIVDLYYVVGDYLVLALDAQTGAKKWSSSYRVDQYIQLSQANDVAVSPDGEEIYVTGQSGDAFPMGQDWDLATVAYDANTGERLWDARRTSALYVSGSIRKSPDAAMAVQVDPSGERVYVTGHEHGGRDLNDFRYVTIAYEAADEEHLGETLWTATHTAGPEHRSMARALEVTPDGRTVVVTGEYEFKDRSTPEPDTSAFGTVAYDARTGEQRWSASWKVPNTPTERIHIAEDLVVSPDGTRAYVTGPSSGAVGLSQTFATVAYAIDTGNELWAETWDAPVARASVVRASALSADGSRLYLAGVASPGSPLKGGEFATVAMNTATGDVAWAARYGLTTTEDHESALAVAATPDGGVIVAGAVISGSGSSAPGGDKGDYTILRYAGL